jgi:hypothetical protein
MANADKREVHIHLLIVMNSRSTMRTEGGSLRVEVSPNVAKLIVITSVGHVFNSSWTSALDPGVIKILLFMITNITA